MKTTITAAVLAMSLMGTSSAFANETQSLVSNSGMQISEISMAQDFSAFNGIETFDVSKAELDEVTGEGQFTDQATWFVIYSYGLAAAFTAGVWNAGVTTGEWLTR